MFILNLKCKNFFLFQDLDIDFTYPRKLAYEITKNDTLFDGSKIKVRKNIIIMGANAAGKTTIGHLLCLIYNYLIGRDNGTADDLARSIYAPDHDASFTIEFAIEKTAYRLTATFDHEGLKEEIIHETPISPAYNITELRERLGSSTPLYYSREEEPEQILPGFRSYLLRLKKHERLAALWRTNVQFWFALSSFRNDPIGKSRLAHINIPMISKILPILDNSVKDVIALVPEAKPSPAAIAEPTVPYGNPPKSYTIRFKNGQELTVPDGDLSAIHTHRLSQGTVEALAFSTILSCLQIVDDHMIFVDECLSHMHSELEKYLVWLSFLMKKENSQLIFTTHNVEICDLKLPTNAFLFLKREKDGFNTALWASSKLIKNDRNFRSYYENDYFGVLPDYSSLVTLLEKDSEASHD